MGQTIFIAVRKVYGVPTMYPACRTSERLCRLTGRKTITSADLQTIKSLGYVPREAASGAGAGLGLVA